MLPMPLENYITVPLCCMPAALTAQLAHTSCFFFSNKSLLNLGLIWLNIQSYC